MTSLPNCYRCGRQPCECGAALYHGCCLEVMPAMAPGSVDLVFGSPPYEDARTYGIDFRLKGQDWVDWMVKVVQESLRVSRGLVAFVVEGKTRKFRYSATPILLMADLHRAGVHLRKPPAFQRVGIPGSGGPDWLRNDYEFIVCCTNGGKLPWSENTVMGHPPKWAPGGAMSNRHADGRRTNSKAGLKATARRARKGVNQWGHAYASGKIGVDKDGVTEKAGARPSHIRADKLHTKTKADGTRELQGYAVPAKANPGNMTQQLYTAAEVIALLEQAGDVTRHNVGGGQMGDPLAHKNEAPFPESLAEFFIRSFCPPDGIVLDPFSGSGTTVAVARKQGRRGIGIDVRQSQLKIAANRLRQKVLF